MIIRKKGGLGRGLDALLGAATRSETAPEPPAVEILRQVPVEWIERGRYQPRQDLREDTLQELAESIRAQGVVQPVLVRPLGGDRYELIAGERRWRAAQLAGLREVPAVIRDLPDRAAIAVALIENIQREDLSPMEQAQALQRFHDEFGMSHQEIADAVGKARATVSNLLRLMSLSEEVKTLLDHGDLDMGHARALLSLPPIQQSAVARQVVERGWSVRQTEQRVRELMSPVPAREARQAAADIEQLAQRLSERLGAAVQIDHGQQGKGRVTIRYHSLDELDGLLQRMGCDTPA